MNCKFCKKECFSNISKSAHERFCKLNPKYQENLKKHKQTSCKARVVASITSMKKLAQQNPLNEIKTFKLICNKCNKEYFLNLKVRDFNKGNYPKTCSSKCAHSRNHSKQTITKISNSIKTHQHKHICPTCKKEFTK